MYRAEAGAVEDHGKGWYWGYVVYEGRLIFSVCHERGF